LYDPSSFRDEKGVAVVGSKGAGEESSASAAVTIIEASDLRLGD
jgi:hypothetical protein